MKKYIYWVLLLFLLTIVSLRSISAKDMLPLVGKLIVIDPGHGGADPGTAFGSIYEKDINLQISLEIKKVIESYGGSVIMIRSADYDLASPGAMYRKKSDFNNRIDIINKSLADLYLSIHMNYLNDSSYFGPQVFYQNEDKNLAFKMQQSLNKVSRGSRNIKIIPEDTYMYKRLNIRGLLIECGFLSNENEREKLNSPNYQQAIAKAVGQGLIMYFT